jgi:hypothetical protein
MRARCSRTTADLLVSEKASVRQETMTLEAEKQVVGGSPITHQRRPGCSEPLL